MQKVFTANVDGKRILYAFPRQHGDPRTTGRSETASERRRRKREESRGHRPRRTTIGSHAASSSLRTTDARLSVDGGPEIPVKDISINEYGVPVDEADPITGEPTERESLDPRDGQCNATTKKGTRCKRRTDGLYCTTHKEQNQ